MKTKENIVTEDGVRYSKKYIEEPEVFANTFKGQRAMTVETITVDVLIEAGTTETFQGDEVSQNRLHRAYTVLKDKPLTSLPWKTADNKTVFITEADALEIIYQAGLAQTNVWF